MSDVEVLTKILAVLEKMLQLELDQKLPKDEHAKYKVAEVA